MNVTADFFIRSLRADGIDVPAFDDIAELMARPYAPRLPADPGDFDLAEEMAAGTLTAQRYDAYLRRAAMLAHAATHTTETRARELRNRDAIELLQRDGDEIGRILRAKAKAAVDEWKAADARLRKAGIHDVVRAMKDPQHASDWATRDQAHERRQRLQTTYDAVLAIGICTVPATDALAASDGVVRRAFARLGGGR